MKINSLVLSLGGLVLASVLSSTNANAFNACGEGRALRREVNEIRRLDAAAAAVVAALAAAVADSSSEEEVLRSELSQLSTPSLSDED